jgi:hypothetical protein
LQLGIIGLPGAGKSTIFRVLTKTKTDQAGKKGPTIGTVRVPDERVDTLRNLFEPKKTVYAHLEYLLPKAEKAYGVEGKGGEGFWNEVRPCDALVHVVRNFRLPGGDAPHPREDLIKMEGDMIVSDLEVVERRIETVNLDRKRGRKGNEEEMALLEQCLKVLEEERPLRDAPELVAAPLLRGYAFLSAKPALITFNNDDEDESDPLGKKAPGNSCVVRGKLESDLAELSPEEAAEFLREYRVKGSAAERVVRRSCDLLGLVSFFTVVHEEVHCWMIPKGTTAPDAAGVIHSDMKKGFIRAEVLAFEDLIACGTYQQAKKEAKVRVEGKDYVVQDGDVIYFRFSV